MTDELFNQASILKAEVKNLYSIICLLKNIPTKDFSISASSIGGRVDHACHFHLDGDLLIEFLQKELEKKERQFAKL